MTVPGPITSSGVATSLLAAILWLAGASALRAQADTTAVPSPDPASIAVSDTLSSGANRAQGKESNRTQSAGTTRASFPDSAKSPPLLEYTVDADAVVRWRLQQLVGAPQHGFLLRSTSSMLELRDGQRRFLSLRPSTRMVLNTAMPNSANDGPLWAGQGPNSITTGGIRLAAGRLRVVLIPQLVLSTNSGGHIRDTTIWWSPHPAEGRAGREYNLTWYQGRFSIDLPLRFGGGARAFIDPGQSAIYAKAGPAEVGFATENNWWGPGIRNALVLSNTAPGFPHLFLRSAYPWSTWFGAVEWRWLTGALEESDFFDDDPENDTRSLTALAVVLQPRFSKGLSLGATRSVMARSSGFLSSLGSWPQLFQRTGRSEPVLHWADPTNTDGREHIVALFGRYVVADGGAEIYGEWGRTALSSIRDILIAPNHTQGYTLGLQWSRPMRREQSRLQVQAEVTTVEQSATFRNRPLGTWYASRRVVQGYTHRGEMLGAAIGPGSSGQWLAVDYFTPVSSFGGYLGRTRFNEDIRSVFEWPAYMPYCNHDVATYVGFRGTRHRRWGMMAADVSYAKRINAYFQVASCFAPGYRDLNHATVRLTFAPHI